MSASFVSLLLGLVMVNLLQPGANFPGTLPDKARVDRPAGVSVLDRKVPDPFDPDLDRGCDGAERDPADRGVRGVLRRRAWRDAGARSKPIISLIDDLAHIMLKVTGYVMLFAPIAVLGGNHGDRGEEWLLLVLWKLIQFMGGFYLSLLILWAILIVVGFIVIGPRYAHLLRLIREPLMIAFSTASSEAAYPKTLEGPQQVRRLVADLGLRAAARLFLQPRRHDDVLHLCEHLHRADLSDRNVGRHAARDAGDADDHLEGRRRRAAARVAGGDRLDAQPVRHPEAGLLMIMGIDTFLDMGRSATNVIGNSLATAVVRESGRARAEGRA